MTNHADNITIAGGPVPWQKPFDNLTATAAPTASNDTTQNYSAGSTWLDTTAQMFWKCVDSTAGAAVWIAVQVSDSPTFVTSRFYATYEGTTNAATAVATLDTVLFLYPYYQRQKITATSLNIRVVTGAAGSAVKVGVWSSSLTTGKPSGLPIAGLVSNTGQATTGSTTTAALTGLSAVMSPGVYWYGSAFTTLGPTCISIASGSGTLAAIGGRASMANGTISGYTVPYTYSADITALNLTGATLSDALGAMGIPIIHIGT